MPPKLLRHQMNNYINNYSIEKHCRLKFSRVLLDEYPLWKDHIQYTENKISKNIGILCKTRDYLSKQKFMIITLCLYSHKCKLWLCHCVKSVRIRSYSGPYFSAFGLNTVRCGVSFRIQSEHGKIRTRVTPNTDTFYTVYSMARMIRTNLKENPHPAKASHSCDHS